MPFLVSLIPTWFLYIFNFLRYTIRYKSFFISPRSFIFHSCLGKRVLIGGGFYLHNCNVGCYTNLSGSEAGGLHSHIEDADIGKYCSFGKNIQILSHGHRVDFISTFPFHSNVQSFLYKESRLNHDITTKKTRIGNDVWIGTNVTIVGGVTIGDGAIIGAGSVVTKDVAPYTVVAGNPARLIRERFTPKQRESLLKIKWWDKSEKEIRELHHLLMSDRCDEFVKKFAKN